MAKIYVFNSRTDTITSPWSQVNTWNGRYVRLGSLYSDHGVLLGVANHVHEGNIIIDDAAATLGYYAGGNLPQHYYTRQHTHTPAGWSQSTENNDPLYYDLTLMSCDMTYWENTERRFPMGTVILADTGGLLDAEWSRFTAADTRFLRLAATPGGTGGRATNCHTLSGGLNNYVETSFCGPNALNNVTSGQTFDSQAGHGHSINFTVADGSIYPKWLATRAYVATQLTTHAPAGVIVFVDASPSTNFQNMNWSGCNLNINDVNPVSGGSDTHNHVVTGNTTAYTGTNLPSTYWTAYSVNYIDRYFVPNGHYHYAHGELVAASSIPLSVTLIAVKLKNTLYHVESHDKTYQMSALLRKTQDKTYGSSTRVKGTGVAIYTPDMLLKKITDFTYNVGLALANNFDDEYLMDMLLKKTKSSSYSMSMRLPKNSVNYGASLRLIKPYGALDTVINTLYHSWVDQFDKIDQELQMLQVANRIDWAGGSDLDNRWGKLMDLPRMTDEGDESYRKRLQAYVQILTGCGTKANVEAVLDFLVDEPGASRVVQGPPGEVRIYFQTDTAVRTAKEKVDLINNLMPKMIAVGIQYKVYYPFIDYFMSILLQGPNSKDYDVDMLLKKPDVDFSYYMRIKLVSRKELSYDADLHLLKAMDEIYRTDMRISKTQIESYLMGIILQDTKDLEYEIGMILTSIQNSPYQMDLLLLRNDIQVLYKVDVCLKKGRDLTYRIAATLSKTQTSDYGASMLVITE